MFPGSVGIGALELWGSLFCLIAAFSIDRGKTVEKRENIQLGYLLLINTVILVFDMFAVTYNGEPGNVSRVILRVANFGLFFSLYLLEIYFLAYLKAVIVNNGGSFSVWFKYLGILLMVISIVILVFDQYTHRIYYFDENNIYHRGESYVLALMPVFICFALILFIVFYSRHYFSNLQVLALLIYLSFPVCSAIIMVVTGEVSSIINISITISLMLMYLFYEIEKNQRMLKQAEELVEAERANNQFKNYMLWTQIQPHFIYNNLNVIQFLCRKDPELAAEAVVNLSAFLRSYIDAYDMDVCIPISEELEIINHYLYMQKLRYGDRLEVEIAVSCEHFSVPPLSVETLVENAVRHGVAKKTEGGRVSIRVYEDENEYLAKVEDNGVGFDSSELETDDGKNHVGLKNTNSRLKFMINGYLEVESQVGHGCKAIVHVPKGKKDEVSDS
ncbi:sensor histidine kinase [Pseudobutyrivibrio xylanivorans]|uniref:Histidine kinase-, DNA gyrase B-, and HSP90-like ATPase n=1 Tax=Pseudobutyrivibrio xylanivorans DSM 14809 TaxID=1123012 RepID=A0A1M6BAB1_PSEXY|nr:histidine kinase [Pseudobutyrivibrio xylanivorans]SHI45626.1 Histidine kinase-, DNA gyrase B-, and HSP90-like ATPase [Pseudobutyrivibrio xylanivorans DSM 14809]